jgi:sec-independent protein translocase protein TatB
MFDVTSSKLLLLGIVALIVIGPKDLPALLRTLGKYVGIVRRHAADFRAQFEEAMRESELDQLKKEVESMGHEAEASMREAEHVVTSELDAAKADVERVTDASSTGAHTSEQETANSEVAVLEEKSDSVNGAATPEPAQQDAPRPAAAAEHKSGA